MQNPEIKCKKKNFFSLSYNIVIRLFITVINVWTTDQQNTKTNKKILSGDDASNRMRFNGSNQISSSGGGGGGSAFGPNVGQGKYTHHQSSSLGLNMLANKFSNQLAISDHPMTSSSSTSDFFHHRPLTQSNSIANQSDSHNNYVEIDTLETLLYKNQQQQQQESDNFPQYSNTPYNPSDYSDNHNAHDQLALSSPIYENQAVVRRSESPIYSNTHNNQSVTSLYSNQSQNLYSNLPSGLSNNNSASSATAAYANLPSSLHHGLVPASMTFNIDKLFIIILLSSLFLLHIQFTVHMSMNCLCLQVMFLFQLSSLHLIELIYFF